MVWKLRVRIFKKIKQTVRCTSNRSPAPCFVPGDVRTLSGDGTLIPNGVGPQIWRVSQAATPLAPDWSVNRFFSIDHVTGSSASSAAATGDAAAILNSVGASAGTTAVGGGTGSTDVQEQLLVQDLLYAMMAVPGKWITLASSAPATTPAGGGAAASNSQQQPTTASPTFRINPQITEASFVDVLKRMIPICDYYAAVQQHITVHNRFEYGVVNHAFCSAVRVLLKEYLLLIAQLESQCNKRALTLLRCWFYIQPSLATMERLARLCAKCGAATGGALLNVIHTAYLQAGYGIGCFLGLVIGCCQ